MSVGALKDLAASAQAVEQELAEKAMESGPITSPGEFAKLKPGHTRTVPAIGAALTVADFAKFASRPEDTPMLWGVRGTRILVVGGFLESEQDKELRQELERSGTCPPDLNFRTMAQELITTGRLEPQAYFDPDRPAIATLQGELRREIEDKMGRAASDLVTLENLINIGPRETLFSPVRFGEKNRAIVEAVNDASVQLVDEEDEEKGVKGIGHRCSEQAMLATAKDLTAVQEASEQTIRLPGGTQILTVGEVIEAGRSGNPTESGHRVDAPSWLYYARALLLEMAKRAA